MLPSLITPKYVREKDNLMSKVTEEQRVLESEKKWQMVNMIKSRRALGGDLSLPKISPINNSPRMSHFMMKNPKNKKQPL